MATMGGYWDALSASALAGLEGCPILLTDGSSLSSQTASEVKRLGASKVYIVGGTAAVSSEVASSLKDVPGVKSVKRLAGDVAVNTALKIYEEGKGRWGKTAVVATSETFQDALSVSPYAYAKKAPVFLANASTHTLDPQVLSAIKKGGFSRVIIVGGTAALSPQLEDRQLKGITCKRLAGPTAYETSGAIATWCLTQGMSAATVGVATGASYYDALAGAALCGKSNAPLVLVADGWTSNVSGFLKRNKNSIEHVYVFGGSAAVSTSIYDSISATLNA
ncbi:cell wall-binding repeat-containing protein [Eggerthella lenta]|uniref:Cell wall-binding repeat-containing protein n=1 Tax=Eggerthella lenta TaxID=84112 RepID=A0A5C5BUG1_EGGLN|nr:cell wall-binding repeat-containing protein [Eggerthella lenta]